MLLAKKPVILSTMSAWKQATLIISGALAGVLLAGCTASDPDASTSTQPGTPDASQGQLETPDPGSPSAEGDSATDGGTTETEMADTENDSPPVEDPDPEAFLLPGGVSSAVDIPTADVITGTTGTVTNDSLRVERTIEPLTTPDGDQVRAAYQLYVSGPVVKAFTKRNTASGRILCLSKGEGSTSCLYPMDDGSFPYPTAVTDPGTYDVYLGDPGNSGAAPKKKDILGTLTFSPPTDVAISDPTCVLTGGQAVRDGKNYTVTINHEGQCASTQAFISQTTVQGPHSSGDFTAATNVNGSELVSHNNKTTVITFATETKEPTTWDGSTFTPKEVRVVAKSKAPDTAPSILNIPIS